MQKLIAELKRLYLIDSPDAPDASAFAAHLRGETTLNVDLANPAGMARALVLEFHKTGDDAHWQRLCEVANALQQDLGLPAPAVSVSGGSSYGLWLSFDTAMPLARLRQFHALLHQAYFEDEKVDFGKTVVEPPPCLHRATGLWAAFINPGMGASFADELGLEMAPPISAQAAFLDGLRAITAEEFTHALARLQQRHQAAPVVTTATPATPEGVLLKDATLEQIIALLHERNIEPSFRHLIGR
jgi:hypothetical protein